MEDLKVISTENTLCLCCMEEHEVKTVQVRKSTLFKGVQVDYDAEYFYCDRADEFLADERMFLENYSKIKYAYEEKIRLAG